MSHKLEEAIYLNTGFELEICVEDGRVYTYLYARFVTFLSDKSEDLVPFVTSTGNTRKLLSQDSGKCPSRLCVTLG